MCQGKLLIFTYENVCLLLTAALIFRISINHKVYDFSNNQIRYFPERRY